MRLENERYVATFTTKGGEIESFTDKQTGIQYMYQGDTPYWGGSNPTLFPIVGSTFTKDYEIDGKKYAMKNHGLIRYAQLHEIEAGEGEVAMAMDSDEDTRAKYPFDFHYEIRYRLEGAKLHVTYFITNTGDRDMPFSFGLHPGFRCPLCEGERFEDYTVRFSQPEEMTQLVMDLSGKTPYENKAVSLQEIPCDYALFAQYSTLIYRGMKSSFVTLEGKAHHGVKVDISGYPLFAVWTAATDAPFICLEPWYGHSDFSEVKEDFYHREGTQILSAGQTFTTAYAIEVF